MSGIIALSFPGSPGVCDINSSMTEVKGQVDRLRTELNQKEERITDLERERQTLEFCIQELKSALEEEKRSRAVVLRETEQKVAEEQRTFQSVITRMNETEEKLAAVLRTSKMEEQGSEIEHKSTVIKNLEQEMTRLKQEAEDTRDEVSRLRKENESKGERVKILEGQLLENENTHDNLQKVNSDLLAENTNMKGVIKELEEKAALLLVKESTLKQKHRTDPELSDKEARLAKREAELAAKEAELSVAQQEAQEARKREVERRRELLAVAEEAIAQKGAELQKREAEITR